MHIAYRPFAVVDNGDVISEGEIRYTFTVDRGRPARTWANASGNFHPAEGPSVDVTEVAIRGNDRHPWRIVDGIAADYFVADVPDKWFYDWIEAEADE